jgi:signal transduction histidine kinase
MSRLLIIAEDPEHARAVGRLLEENGLADDIVVQSDPARDVAAHYNLHRLAQVGTLAAGAAHEINNLLTYLSITLSQSIRRAGAGLPGSPEEPVASWKSALEVCNRMQSIVRDLTGFARSNGDGTTLLCLEDVLDEAVRLGEASVRACADVVREGGGGLPHLRANRVQLVQVFLNLIINSAQAIAQSESDRGQIIIRTAAEGDRLRVDVEDDGCGIAPENMPRIFEAFYSTKPGEVGTGLGLFLTRAIVRRHGGDVEVSSVVGAGTRISVSLPAAGR